MNKPPILSRYSIPLYPRTLWVGLINKESINYIQNNFIDVNGGKLINVELLMAGAMRVISKKGCYGYIVVLSPNEIHNIKTIAHEAYHVTDFLSEDMGMEYKYNSGNEHIAYIVGCIAGLIVKGINKLII